MKKLSNILFRLTILLWIPVIVYILFIHNPINWLITGKYHSKFAGSQFMYAWGKRLGVNY